MIYTVPWVVSRVVVQDCRIMTVYPCMWGCGAVASKVVCVLHAVPYIPVIVYGRRATTRTLTVLGSQVSFMATIGVYRGATLLVVVPLFKSPTSDLSDQVIWRHFSYICEGLSPLGHR